MKRMLVLGGLLLAGCAINFNAAIEVRNDPDFTNWQHSPAARQGYIFITGRIERNQAARVANQIIALDQDHKIYRITLVINSDGGETPGFRAIYNAIRMTTKPVDALNIGNCYSAACGIFAAATGRRMAYRNTHFMVHRPTIHGVLLRGRYKEMVDFETDIYEAVLKDAGRLPKQWFPLTAEMHFFTAQEAKEYRFVDTVVESLPEVEKYLPQGYQESSMN